MRYRLKRRDDGACVYLGADNLCSIYGQRPRMCQEFHCRTGWRLRRVFPRARQAEDSSPDGQKKLFLEELGDELIFVLHPLLKLLDVQCFPEKQQVVFALQLAGRCGPFTAVDDFQNPKLDSDSFRGVIDLFATKDPLGEVKRRARQRLELELTQAEFGELLWLLQKHRIIVDSREYSGTMASRGPPAVVDSG
jgi:hypothetical protein